MSAEKSTKWTPGPWKRKYLPQHRQRITAPESANATICEIAFWRVDYAEQFANGRLISKAPEMAELLGRIVRHDGPASTLPLSEAAALLAYINGEGE